MVAGDQGGEHQAAVQLIGAACRAGHGDSAARTADAGGADRAAEGRHRGLVAGDQGGRNIKLRKGGCNEATTWCNPACHLARISAATAQSYPSRPVTHGRAVPGRRRDRRAGALSRRAHAAQRSASRSSSRTSPALRGTIGVGRAVRAPPDGYTVQIGTSTTNVMTGALYALQFDLMTDLDPIILIASEPMMIVGKKDFPANNLKELIAWLKANPGQGVGRHSRRRRHRASHRARIPEGDRHRRSSSCRIAATRPRCRTLSPARSTCRWSRRRTSTRRSKAGAIKPFAMTSKTRIGGCARDPDHGRGRACRALSPRSGTACGCRRTRRRRSSRGSTR